MNPIQNFNQVSANELLNNVEYNKRSIAPPIHTKPPALEREYYLVIDSRKRNTSIYPNPNSYKIDLETPLRDIRSITLTNATIPRNSDDPGENQIYLHFDEFNIFDTTGHYGNDGVFNSCEGADKCFSNIGLNCDPGKYYFFAEDSPCTIDFRTRKSMLSSFTISWKIHDGSLYTFDNTKEHNLTLKIICGEEKK